MIFIRTLEVSPFKMNGKNMQQNFLIEKALLA